MTVTMMTDRIVTMESVDRGKTVTFMMERILSVVTMYRGMRVTMMRVGERTILMRTTKGSSSTALSKWTR